MKGLTSTEIKNELESILREFISSNLNIVEQAMKMPLSSYSKMVINEEIIEKSEIFNSEYLKNF